MAPGEKGEHMGMPSDTRSAGSDDLRAIRDERDIHAVVLRYCRGVDRLDPTLVRSCYHDDATDEHGSFSGTADEFVTWVFRLLPRYDMTMHLVANVLIDLLGDVARVESYGVAVHRTEDRHPFEPSSNLTTGFRFIDRFERRGEWRIAKRVATTEWSRIDPEAGRWPVPPGMRRGSRDETDPVWWLVPEAGPPPSMPPATRTGDREPGDLRGK